MRRFEGGKTIVARFEKATMVGVEQEPQEDDSTILDIIGFDCYPNKGSWEFVLNCGSVEWVWKSSWPTVERS